MAANNVLLIFLSIWILSVSSEHSQCKLDHVPENWRVGVKDVVAAASSPVDFNLQRDGHVYEVGVRTHSHYSNIGMKCHLDINIYNIYVGIYW